MRQVESATHAGGTGHQIHTGKCKPAAAARWLQDASSLPAGRLSSKACTTLAGAIRTSASLVIFLQV